MQRMEDNVDTPTPTLGVDLSTPRSSPQDPFSVKLSGSALNSDLFLISKPLCVMDRSKHRPPPTESQAISHFQARLSAPAPY